MARCASVTIALLGLVLGACSGVGAETEGAPTVHPEGVRMTSGEAWVLWLPRVKLQGLWRGGGADGACTAEENAVTCPAGPAGFVRAVAEETRVRVEFLSNSAVKLQGLALDGVGELPGATAWLSNGFQSWSQSGAVALGERVSGADLTGALAASGDAEVFRRGHELSWWHTAVGGGGQSLVAGVLPPVRFPAWIEVYREADGLRVRLVAGGTGEEIRLLPGEILAAPWWWIGLGPDATALLRSFGEALPARWDTVPRAAEAGWNSWYELWDRVDEASVRANAALAKEILDPLLPAGAGPLRITVDDGWQMAWGRWEPNGKFPSGLDGLAADLKKEGFRMGVWLAPLLVAEGDPLVAEHPDWFVEGARWTHLKNGAMRILDVTHPDAAAHLREVIQRLVGWGYDLLKIDFLFAGAFPGKRHEEVLGVEALERALGIIRAAAGEDVLLVAVGSPPTPVLPYVDVWRLGHDIAVEPFGPSWAYVPNPLRSLAVRWPYCAAVLCDADPALLRDLPREEVETGSWVVGLAGGAFFLSDDLRALPAERRTWGVDGDRVGLGLSGSSAVPEDLFPAAPPERLVDPITDHLAKTSTHVLPRIWRLPDGRRLGINTSDAPIDLEGTTIPARGTRVLPRQVESERR